MNVQAKQVRAVERWQQRISSVLRRVEYVTEQCRVECNKEINANEGDVSLTKSQPCIDKHG